MIIKIVFIPNLSDRPELLDVGFEAGSIFYGFVESIVEHPDGDVVYGLKSPALIGGIARLSAIALRYTPKSDAEFKQFLMLEWLADGGKVKVRSEIPVKAYMEVRQLPSCEPPQEWD